jgi:transcriptional regulator with XRE-family HTH domain
MLITARKQAGLTQVEVADRLGRPQSYVSKYERGERRLDVIEFFDVAQAIEIDPFDFLKRLHRSLDGPGEELT